MNRLSKIANKFETDKGTTHRDAHGYTEFYQPFFEKYDSPKILEIGTYQGGSARMFNEFFDGDCEIWTCDFIDECANYVKDLPNVHFVHLDAGDVDAINAFRTEMQNNGIEFDIIIDDSSHIWQHQMNLLYGLHTLLSENGIFIIEDIHYSRLFSDPENSPLFFINFLYPNVMLSDEANNELIDKIDEVQIFSRKNNTFDMPIKYGGRSITSIITFEK